MAPPGRIVAILPTVFLLLSIAGCGFAWFGHVDIVVTTTGRIVPVGKVKLVQPSAPGTIAEILVAEGDVVEAGQPLVVGGTGGQAGSQAPPSYTATIALEEESVTVDGREVRLTPGMTITADIRTGTRRVAEFILQPVLRYTAEGFRER